MLSYQHAYHAGNFADVIKHFTLTRLFDYMILKEKPFVYIDTHAGRGMYDLKTKLSTKTSEFLQGIALLWEQQDNAPPSLTSYLAYLQQLNPNQQLRFYPGSPTIALHKLRSEDRAFCLERHPREFEHLNELPREGKRVFYRECDGMKELAALLPPLERRGIIFIDPSYELKEEYQQIPLYLKSAYERFSTGVFCLWYPIIDQYSHNKITRGLTAIPASSTLRIEFFLNQKNHKGMQGCGLWMINPPYTLAQEAKEALNFLKTIFNPGGSSFLIN